MPIKIRNKTLINKNVSVFLTLLVLLFLLLLESAAFSQEDNSAFKKSSKKNNIRKSKKAQSEVNCFLLPDKLIFISCSSLDRSGKVMCNGFEQQLEKILFSMKLSLQTNGKKSIFIINLGGGRSSKWARAFNSLTLLLRIPTYKIQRFALKMLAKIPSREARCLGGRMVILLSPYFNRRAVPYGEFVSLLSLRFTKNGRAVIPYARTISDRRDRGISPRLIYQQVAPSILTQFSLMKYIYDQLPYVWRKISRRADLSIRRTMKKYWKPLSSKLFDVLASGKNKKSLTYLKELLSKKKSLSSSRIRLKKLLYSLPHNFQKEVHPLINAL